MPVKVVVGMQWGDEGKGKMVDALAGQADLVARFQGGDNAGHTVVNPHGVFKLNLVPCGVFRDECDNLIGTGTVVNLDVLHHELESLEAAGVSTRRLYLSDRAQLVLPQHPLLDAAMERGKGIGTTKRGIGQAYADKCLRINLRAGDLRDMEGLKDKLARSVEMANALSAHFGLPPVELKTLLAHCQQWAQWAVPRLCDGFACIHKALESGKRILFEGQLGVMRDVDLGVYPYVTSSHPVAAYAAVSGGFPAARIDSVCGVFKAFSSAVGDGPFPTEMEEADSARLRGDGGQPDDEYGARTGRPRRIGWLDLPTLRYAHQVNGFTELAMTKLDKLDGLPAIRVCTGYRLDGKPYTSAPDAQTLGRVEPVYEQLPGWQTNTSHCAVYSALPDQAKAYIAMVEQTLGVPIRYVGNGPARENLLIRPD